MPSFDAVRERVRRPFDDVARTPRGLVPLSQDPVDDETVLLCLDLAAQAVGAAPRRCEFIVLRDGDRKHQLARIYRQGWAVYRRLLRARRASGIAARQWEADHFEDVPVVVVACVHGARPVFPAFSATRYYGSVFPALENLLLAAHSIGLGATVTTLPIWSAWQARRTLDLPWNVSAVAVVPLGWPKDPAALPAEPARVELRVHHDRWGSRQPAGPAPAVRPPVDS
ncbi:MAG: nitroreductase family protein [Pseudonocardia sp.]|nr:nitroreductase family protein [Pseudonocardia sp.]